MKIIQGKSVGNSDTPLSEELITADKLKEEQDRTQKMREGQKAEAKGKFLWGKNPSASYAGDKAYQDTENEIAQRERWGYGGRG